MSHRSLRIVLDPGHGGDTPAGGSSPNHARSTSGLLEKDLALALAQHTERALRGRATVSLTRPDDRNLPLRARANLAKQQQANLFVSLHWNAATDPATDGTEAFIARQANPGSRVLARRLSARISRAAGTQDRGVTERDFGVLLPSRHDPSTAACLLKIAYLSAPEQAQRLQNPEYLAGLATALAEALIELPAVSAGLALGDDSPLLNMATNECFRRLAEYRRNASRATNPNVRSASRIQRETGVRVDANPYVGITQEEIRAVVRAAYYSHQPAEVLLALWVKEGSSVSHTAPVPITQASTAANAKSLFRSNVMYEDLGTDHFLVTTRPTAGGDNIYDPSDAMAPRHEAQFTNAIAALVRDGLLAEDLAAPINREMTVTGSSAGSLRVQPSNRFYTLLLLLADAYFTQLLRNRFPQIASISVPLNYLQWNMGTATFRRFLENAVTHGRLPNLEHWALHTVPRAGEWEGPRRNAIRFLFYLESYRPIFDGVQSLIRPGAEDLPQARPRNGTAIARRATPSAPVRSATVEALSADPVAYQGNAYTPAAATFNCTPDPPTVIAATLLPNPSSTADADCRTALQAVGLNATEVRRFEADDGFVTLRPLATAFGAAMLTELLRRLRYNTHQIKNPPHTFGTPDRLRTQTGLSVASALGVRLLLTIPGHFRELARRAPNETEAFALENLGWLLMGSLRSDVNSAVGRQFWLPERPAWVTPFSNPLPAYSSQIQRLILRTALIDTTLALGDFRAKERQWTTGLPGRHWSLETGRTTSPLGVGQPFYPAIVSIPAAVNTTTERNQITQVWNQIVAETDAAHGRLTPAATRVLTNCGAHNHRLATLRLTTSVSYGGLELANVWPKLVPAAGARSRGLFTSGTVLRAIQPTAELLFRTIHDLGWHDLLFHTAGSFCLRGIKNGTAQSARRISDHGFAIAFDLNVFENPQLRPRVVVVPGTMDPRIVKIFESFHFQWGKCFRPSDLHHFDYQ